MIMGLGGCGKQKYQLNFDGYGFESKKTSYAPGDTVTVYYGMIATDTDYHFSCDDDVSMEQEYMAPRADAKRFRRHTANCIARAAHPAHQRADSLPGGKTGVGRVRDFPDALDPRDDRLPDMVPPDLVQTQ